VTVMRRLRPGLALPSRCAGCGAPIVWRRTAADRWTPVDLDGEPHWGTCPKAAQFRRAARLRILRGGVPRQLRLLPPPVRVEDPPR
jgi:hypothetical protein